MYNVIITDIINIIDKPIIDYFIFENPIIINLIFERQIIDFIFEDLIHRPF